jgi:tetratricopeptide (TPR) repeat protein
MKRSARVALALVASSLLPALARADTPPGVWDLAKDAAERDRWALHVRVQRLIQPTAETELDGGEMTRAARTLRLESARAMLEQGDAAHSPDVRLQFDLGIVDYELGEKEARADLFQEAIDVLAPAIEKHPDHPATTEAMERLVYCYVKLNRPEDELAGWHRYIPRLVDDRARSVALMNMGEAEMRLGHIDDAVETFREVLRILTLLPNSMSTYVLTAWDLAVALDRSGDSRGATDEASRILGMSVFGGGSPLGIRASRALRGTLILRSPGVFFVPAWELEWYLALAAAADARDAPDAHAAAESWSEAEGHFRRYVEQSSTSSEHDPWLPIARVRLAHAHSQRVEAEARAARARNVGQAGQAGPPRVP